MGVCSQMLVLLIVVFACARARPSDPSRESRAANEFKVEHRAIPADTKLINLQYYGGAEGNVLVYHPTLGLAPALMKKDGGRRDEEDVGQEEEEQGGGGGGDGGAGGGGDSEGVAIQPPPPGASIAEVRPVGLSIAGIGGVAASKPTGTAVVGPGGLAIARPVATAIAGVPPDAVLGPGPGGPVQHREIPSTIAKQQGYKYGLVPMARNIPVRYYSFQPEYNSLQYNQQPVVLYPIAYY